MLVLTSRLHEKIVLPEAQTTIEVVGIQGTSVRLGFQAPEAMRILRESIPDRVAEWGPEQSTTSSVGAGDLPTGPSLQQVEQLVDRRLELARKGVREVQLCLREGRTADAEDLLLRVEDELYLLRRRLRREVAQVSGRESALCAI